MLRWATGGALTSLGSATGGALTSPGWAAGGALTSPGWAAGGALTALGWAGSSGGPAATAASRTPILCHLFLFLFLFLFIRLKIERYIIKLISLRNFGKKLINDHKIKGQNGLKHDNTAPSHCPNWGLHKV